MLQQRLLNLISISPLYYHFNVFIKCIKTTNLCGDAGAKYIEIEPLGQVRSFYQWQWPRSSVNWIMHCMHGLPSHSPLHCVSRGSHQQRKHCRGNPHQHQSRHQSDPVLHTWEEMSPRPVTTLMTPQPEFRVVINLHQPMLQCTQLKGRCKCKTQRYFAYLSCG